MPDMPSTRPPAPPPAVPSAWAVLKRVLARGETIRLLTRSQLAAGHRDKLLGHLWSLLDPLASLAVYYLDFGIGFRQAGSSPRTRRSKSVRLSLSKVRNRCSQAPRALLPR